MLMPIFVSDAKPSIRFVKGILAFHNPVKWKHQQPAMLKRGSYAM
jgi:hypothetical protein